MTVFRQIRDVAGYDYPVHISGETGTGKELVAEAIHNESHRSGAPFVPINCGALPESLIESELFGHVKGAFSGALRDKKGRFELADQGTIFLDEIAELSKQMQVKLLRFLQDGMFEKVGGEKTVHVNVRVISATNKDLKKEIKLGSFRKDLFYRLNVIPIHLPPLRERRNDIPLLIDHFAAENLQGSCFHNDGVSLAGQCSGTAKYHTVCYCELQC
jgi:transcriptional regulator with GAF, ATPase, and Fis domain